MSPHGVGKVWCLYIHCTCMMQVPAGEYDTSEANVSRCLHCPSCMPVTGGLRCTLLPCTLSMQVRMWGEMRGDIVGKGIWEGGKGGGGRWGREGRGRRRRGSVSKSQFANSIQNFAQILPDYSCILQISFEPLRKSQFTYSIQNFAQVCRNYSCKLQIGFPKLHFAII